MAVINCKACKKQSAATLDKKTRKIHCALCDAEQPNNHYVKIQLEAIGAWRGASVDGIEKAFWALTCKSCNSGKRPKLSTSNKIVCSGCGDEYEFLSEPFKILLKDYIKKIGNDPDAYYESK